MLGMFGMFGRSHELQRLDQALRSVGLNPRLVPDAVMLTTPDVYYQRRMRPVSRCTKPGFG